MFGRIRNYSNLALIALIIWTIYTFVLIIIDNNTERKYCGKVVDMFILHNKHRENHVIFYCDSLKKSIDISVNNQLYCNIKKGQDKCFKLTKLQLKQ